MTLKEAVESGKPFRHKSWLPETHFEYAKDISGVALGEAISDEWEIQEKTSFTREDVERAVRVGVEMSSAYFDRYEYKQEAIKAAMKAAEGTDGK